MWNKGNTIWSKLSWNDQAPSKSAATEINLSIVSYIFVFFDRAAVKTSPGASGQWWAPFTTDETLDPHWPTARVRFHALNKFSLTQTHDLHGHWASCCWRFCAPGTRRPAPPEWTASGPRSATETWLGPQIGTGTGTSTTDQRPAASGTTYSFCKSELVLCVEI